MHRRIVILNKSNMYVGNKVFILLKNAYAKLGSVALLSYYEKIAPSIDPSFPLSLMP